MAVRLPVETIRNAFRMHGSIYHDQKAWNIAYHMQCWTRATLAFEGDSFSDFQWLYRELKDRWQALRPTASTAWSAQQVFEHLRGLDVCWRGRSLSEMNDDDVHRIWHVIESMFGMKPMKSGPSVVAISKFLHFWNPRLFVIVDDGIMWRWVFRHQWVRQPLMNTRRRIAPLIGVCPPSGDTCDPLSYLAVLRWCAEIIQTNPQIPALFAEHVYAHGDGTTLVPQIETYEAAAVEWLLLGLVELPPVGVALQ